MTRTLFRKEAVQYKSNSFSNSSVLMSPPGIKAFTALILFFASALGLFLSFGTYAPKDTVRGYVSSVKGDVEIYSQSDGTIVELNIVEGQKVSVGDVLMTLSTARSLGQTISTREQVVSSLKQQLEEIENKRELEKESFAIQTRALDEEAQALRTQVSGMLSKMTVLEAATALAQRELDRLTKLDEAGLVSELDVDRAKSATIEFRLRKQELALSTQASEASLRKLEKSQDDLPLQHRARIAELNSETEKLSLSIAENEGRSVQQVISKHSGIVSGLLVRNGQTVSMSNPMLSIVPEDDQFFVELLIPPRTISFVNENALVKIRYDAYPYQKYGTFDGNIETVARTTVLPTDKRFRIPVSDPVYLATASVNDQFFSVDGVEQRLQSGMTLTADILRDKRRIFEWLFDPLIRATQRL